MADLEQRVLPMVVPAFLAGMAQKPEALVLLTSTLAELWPGEQIQASAEAEGAGVVVRAKARAHVHEAVGVLAEGRD